MDQVLSSEEVLHLFCKKCLPKKLRRTKSYRKIYPNKKGNLREATIHLWEGERYDYSDKIMKVFEPQEQEVSQISNEFVYTLELGHHS